MKRYGYGLGYSRNTRVGTGSPPTQIYDVNSARLVGPNDYLIGGDILSIAGNDFYFSGWFELEEVIDFSASTIFSKAGTGGNREYLFCTETGFVKFYYYNNNVNGTVVSFNATVNANQRYHYVISRTGNNLSLYLDSTLVDTQDCTGMNPPATSQRFLINGRDLLGPLEASEGNTTFVGAKIGSGITQGQVDELYGNGTPPCYDDITTPFDEFWNLGTWTDSNEPLVSQTGSLNNLTVGNNISYVDEGLQVEC